MMHLHGRQDGTIKIMNIDRRSQEELATDVEALAVKARSNNRLGESYIIESNAALIRSNARVEGNVGNLIKVIKDFNAESSKQSAKVVILTKATMILTLLLFIGLVVQIWLAVVAP